MSTVNTPALVIERRANTTTRIEQAAKSGADGVAISVRLTSQGGCVVGDWAADGCRPWAPGSGDRPLLRNELRSITFLDAIDLIAALELHVVAAVEQLSIAGYVATLLGKRFWPQRVLLTSSTAKVLDIAQALAPRVPTGLRVRPSHDPSRALRVAQDLGAVLLPYSFTAARAAAKTMGTMIRMLPLVRDGEDVASLLRDDGCVGVMTTRVPATVALRDGLRQSAPAAPAMSGR